MTNPVTPPVSIGYLGPEGSNSHQALFRLMGRLPELGACQPVSLNSLYGLLEAVTGGEVAYALLPIENALEGSVSEVVEALGQPLAENQPGLHVLLECQVPIRHALIRHPKALDTPVGVVTSHAQALAQCRYSIQQQLGSSVVLERAPSTSDAVRLLAEKPESWAAIGTAAAAERYGMVVVVEEMGDSPDNATRFLLVTHQGGQGKTLGLEPGMPLKTSICIGLQDRPGVLVDLLLVFKAYGINMTRIESRPSRKKMGDYLFYIDVDGDLLASQNERVRMYLEADATTLRINGPYAHLGLL